VLAEGERHVGGLCDQFNMSQPAVSHHMALLRLGGNRRPPPPGQEQLLQPYRHRLSAFQHLQRHGLLNSPREQAPSHSSNPKGAVGWFHALWETRWEEAHLRASRKVKESTPLPVRSRSFPE
jgi:hypothetical protein